MKKTTIPRYDMIEILLVLLSSWVVYGTCQEDFILPAMASLLIVLSTIQILAKPERRTFVPTKSFSWATVLSVSLLLGWVWITLLPRNYPSDFFQSYAIFILQSGSIFIALFLWFNTKYVYRFFFLRLMAWLTASLSVNVNFTYPSLIAFLVFIVINIGVIIFKPVINFRGRSPKSASLIKRLPYIIVFFMIVAALSTTLVFAFKIGDMLYMKFMRDYAFGYKNHHFFKFDPVLQIQGPGYSGRDIHPVLEIDRISDRPIYLNAQIFEKYENGLWFSDQELERTPFDEDPASGENPITITMFENLKTVIPTPRGIISVQGNNGPYEYDPNGLVYSENPNIHKVVVTGSEERASQFNAMPIDRAKYTQIEPRFADLLRHYLHPIIGDKRNAAEIAVTVEQHFRNNYGYSLDVNFKADDNGLLYLIDQRPDAYCSFFSSAMAVMLRSVGIPSRMVVGFLGTELTGRRDQKVRVRVRDAHAWVEAYLPVASGRSEWVRFDPTPPDARNNAINTGRRINQIADAIWLAMVRFRSEFKNLETEKLLTRLIAVLFILVFIRNYPTITRFIRYLRAPGSERALASRLKSIKQFHRIYQEFEKLLQQQYGIRPGESETNTELLDRLKQKLSDESVAYQACAEFVTTYERYRFGNLQTDGLDDDLNRLREKITA